MARWEGLAALPQDQPGSAVQRVQHVLVPPGGQVGFRVIFGGVRLNVAKTGFIVCHSPPPSFLSTCVADKGKTQGGSFGPQRGSLWHQLVCL